MSSDARFVYRLKRFFFSSRRERVFIFVNLNEAIRGVFLFQGKSRKHWDWRFKVMSSSWVSREANCFRFAETTLRTFSTCNSTKEQSTDMCSHSKHKFVNINMSWHSHLNVLRFLINKPPAVAQTNVISPLMLSRDLLGDIREFIPLEIYCARHLLIMGDSGDQSIETKRC